jgi:GNAT superfamily N-acetyltransferase
VSRVAEDRDRTRDSGIRSYPSLPLDFALVRPIVSQDVRPLMRSIGPLVDILYPAGAARLFRRLEEAIAGHASAYVVASPTDMPIALAAEVLKSDRSRKLSTFWVSPLWRRHGIGSMLVANRVQCWLSQEVASVHVTVREKRSHELLSLLGPWGFDPVYIALDRYGEGENELILRWRPEFMYRACPLAGRYAVDKVLRH